MTNPVFAVAKIGKNALTSKDPNDFIFHSSYNTFKIIFEGEAHGTIDASSTVSIEFIFAENSMDVRFPPLVAAFAKDDTKSQVFLPNSEDVDLYGAGLGFTGTGLKFNYVSASILSAIFNFTNTSLSDKDVTIKFYILEKVN